MYRCRCLTWSIICSTIEQQQVHSLIHFLLPLSGRAFICCVTECCPHRRPKKNYCCIAFFHGTPLVCCESTVVEKHCSRGSSQSSYMLLFFCHFNTEEKNNNKSNTEEPDWSQQQIAAEGLSGCVVWSISAAAADFQYICWYVSPLDLELEQCSLRRQFSTHKNQSQLCCRKETLLRLDVCVCTLSAAEVILLLFISHRLSQPFLYFLPSHPNWS